MTDPIEIIAALEQRRWKRFCAQLFDYFQTEFSTGPYPEDLPVRDLRPPTRYMVETEALTIESFQNLPNYLKTFTAMRKLELWLGHDVNDLRAIELGISEEFENAAGIHLLSGDGKTYAIFIPTHLPSDGKRLQDNPENIFYHEIGHDIDAALDKISQSNAYKESFLLDMNRILSQGEKAGGLGILKHTYDRFSYFLPALKDYDKDLDRVYQESFAELVYYALKDRSGKTMGVHIQLPRCFTFVKNTLSKLETCIEDIEWEVALPETRLAL